MFVEMIVERKLFARLNVANAHIENVVLHNPGVTVRIAAVIHILRSASTDIAVNTPIGVECEEVV